MKGAPGTRSAVPGRRSIAVAVLLTIAVWYAGGAAAADLPRPSGPPLLTVTGAIGTHNQGDAAVFDRAMLEALGMQTLETGNPFIEGRHVFEGVLLRDVLRVLGVTEGTLICRALDGYTVHVPVADAYDYDVLLAMIWNGKRMNIRERGPLWIVYPVDGHAELVSEEFSARSIWQLERIDVVR